MTSRRFDVELPRELGAPRLARRFIDEWFAPSLDDTQLDAARLMVTELVSNAFVHGQGKITLRADLDDHRLMVEVIDDGTGFERTVRNADFEDVVGWGLTLVEAESSRWGMHEGTTHVWFEVERSGPRVGRANKP